MAVPVALSSVALEAVVAVLAAEALEVVSAEATLVVAVPVQDGRK